MGYRDFELPDGRTVRTRVSDAATLEWWREFQQTRGRSTRKRPPDVDTEFHRIWVAEPGKDAEEPSLREDAGTGVRAPQATFVMTCPHAGVTVKTIVSALNGPDGPATEILDKVQSFDGDVFVNRAAVIADDRLADEALQHSLQGAARAAADTHEQAEWMIALPSYFDGLEREMAAAGADLRAEREPLPTISYRAT